MAIDRQYSGPLFVTELVHILGLVAVAGTPVGVASVLAYAMNRGETVSATFLALLAAGLIAGWALAGVLLGMSALLRYHHVAARAQQHASPIWGGSGVAGEPVSGGAAGGRSMDDAASLAHPQEVMSREVIALLREMRDLNVLPEGEKAVVADRLRANQKRRAAEAVVSAINLRQISRARELLHEAEVVYGATPTFEKLQDKIAEADARNEPLDYQRARRLVEESIADGSWPRAEQYAHAAFSEHPESSRCRKLWEETRRARLHTHVQERAGAANWQEALAAAEEFIERFPDSTEADALRAQLSTLRANVEISTRKHYENRFKELVSGRQYPEALRIARHVIEHFPGSPQAAALQQQVPALERRVTG
jgi:hypothetical protein